jgi:hypothetical protein
MAGWRLNIRNAALQQAQSALTGYTVRYPNQRGFTPPSNAKWVSTSVILPSEQFRQALTVRDRVDFILQVDIMLPIGSSDIAAYTLADTLDTGFPIDNTPITYNGQEVFVKTVGPPRALPISSEADDAWERYVIRIGLYAFVDRS